MIRDEIKTQLVEAMKNQNKDKVATLRLINSAIKDRDIADRSKGNYDGIDEAGVLSLLQSMIKQRRESIEIYKKGNREDLVAHEQGEIDVIQSNFSEIHVKNSIYSLNSVTYQLIKRFFKRKVFIGFVCVYFRNPKRLDRILTQ
jgi:uncharacterized protein YqeY